VYTVTLPGDSTVRWLAKSSALGNAPEFARDWYSLMVDFWLAGVIGVAMYPYLGNRVWCRFFCPLRAWMEILSKRVGKLAIVANDKCISCGECTRYCQMGIDVQGFAEHGLSFDNRATACIQCGVCVEVCPVDCLSLGQKPGGMVLPASPVGPRWGVARP
jgi:ferredoxin-type protein NapH